jgi:hypothetical protein
MAQITAPIKGLPTASKPWEGVISRKPWEYQVTACLSVLDSIDSLELVVELLRLQTERPYISIVDTGSSPESFARLEKMRASDLEVHQIRANAYRHPSDPVAIACDLQQSLLATPYVFWTHSDCFLMRRDLLADMLIQAQVAQVVGYEMTERDWDSSGFVGHDCCLMSVGLLDRLGAGWSQRRLAHLCGLDDWSPSSERPGYPDTECLINEILREAGIVPKLIGERQWNYTRNKDANIDHCRSSTSADIYAPEYYSLCEQWLSAAMAEARERIKLWRGE